MNKQFAIAFTAVFALASYSFAAYPVNSPLVSDAPSVLIKADVPAEGVVIESAPMPASESPPVYRVVRPSRRSNGGLFSELIELERRKNAWLKKNILSR